MPQLDRHVEIAQCIKSSIEAAFTDPYMAADVRIEDFNLTALPSYGVIVSPEAQQEKYGTNDRDDIEYSTLVTRCVHALHNEDMVRRHQFLVDMRLIFHRKRLTCVAGCHLYASVDLGSVAIPQAWKNNNNSIAIVRVKTLVREHRTRD